MGDESADSYNGYSASNTVGEDIPPDVAKACAPYSKKYNMRHLNRGIAVIFNHVDFSLEGLSERRGSNTDRDNLEALFEELQFDVRVYDDEELYDIRRILQEVSQEDHTDSDCLVVVVLTHGDKGVLYANDRPYEPEILWRNFDARNCPSLAGKPKLFFIQACRGDSSQTGHTVYHQNGVEEDRTTYASYTIPVVADILVMYSTIDGFSSWRHPINGSRFIQSLVHELRIRYRTEDLLTILTYVNQEVAIGYGNTPNRQQMCCFVSMLTRFLYFVDHE